MSPGRGASRASMDTTVCNPPHSLLLMPQRDPDMAPSATPFLCPQHSTAHACRTESFTPTPDDLLSTAPCLVTLCAACMLTQH